MQVKPISEVIAFLQPIATSVGVEIIDAQWNAREKSLTVFIDREGGVDLNLCEIFHHAIDEPLDELDPTYGEPYTLNCSSAGLDRPFKTERDFLKNLGEKIEVHLYAPFGGKKYYEGELLSFTDGVIAVKAGKETIEIPFDKTAKVCLLIEV